MRTALWGVWPYASALVPLAVLALYITNGGWFALFVLISAIVWIPVAVGLALTPWFILRYKHYRDQTPSGLFALMALHWVTALLLAPSSKDYSDAPGFEPAPLASVMGDAGAAVFNRACALVTVLSLLAVLIWSIAIRSRRPRPAPAQWMPPTGPQQYPGN
jgi:hypothetical protein